jgi:hypothetical protein
VEQQQHRPSKRHSDEEREPSLGERGGLHGGLLWAGGPTLRQAAAAAQRPR